jgi:hypothetical protein
LYAQDFSYDAQLLMEWISTQLSQQNIYIFQAVFEEIKKVIKAPHDYAAIRLELSPSL